MQEQVTGMVLSVSPIGEYDKRLVILTKEHGKISAFARGARKATSPLLACTQPFTFGSFSIYRGRNSYTVNSVEVQNYFIELQQDLSRVSYAYYFCEISDYFTVENIDGTAMLKLLYQSFRALIHPSYPNRLIRSVFEWKLLEMNGEAARVFSCVRCGSIEALHIFVPEEQGIFCEDCGKGIRGIHISETTAYTLQRILSSKVEKLYSFSVSETVISELETVSSAYLKNRVQKEFHSLDLFHLTLS